jgi:HEAT repeat protein
LFQHTHETRSVGKRNRRNAIRQSLGEAGVLVGEEDARKILQFLDKNGYALVRKHVAIYVREHFEELEDGLNERMDMLHEPS